RRTIAGLTALSYLPVHLLDVRHALRAVVDHRIAPIGGELGVSLAAEPRRGVADATWIEPDQVESLTDLRARQIDAHRGDHVDRRRPGAARIDQQCSDPRARCRNADDREVHLRATRVCIVDRNRDGPASRARNVARVAQDLAAAPPAQWWWPRVRGGGG